MTSGDPSPTLAHRIQVLEDRTAIHDVLIRYAEAVDTRDLELLASCFSDDAQASFAGIAAPAGGRAIAEFLLSTLGPPTHPTSHLITNVAITVAGDTAQATSRAVVYGIRGEPEQLRLRGISYRDSFTRTGGGWRITRRVHTAAWEGGADHLPLTAIRPATSTDESER